MKKYHLTDYALSPMPLTAWKITQPPHIEPAHEHDCVEIMFASGGSGICRINDMQFPFLRGDIFIMNPNDVHMYKVDRDSSYFNILFKPDVLLTREELDSLREFPLFQKWMDEHHGQKKSISLPPDICTRLESIALDICAELKKQQPGFRQAAKSYFMEFMIVLLRYSSIKSGVKSGNEKQQTAFARAVDYINRHCTGQLTIRKLAKASNVSPTYFGEFFKAWSGTNVFDYITRVRIEKARLLLEQDEMPIGEIAVELGWFDNCRFSRVFKKYTGLSPREYRRSLHL